MCILCPKEARLDDNIYIYWLGETWKTSGMLYSTFLLEQHKSFGPMLACYR